ncbi:MAG: hypothetical protein KC517_09210 [Bacteroidetes bacterium]|nr:hypothetical protein [Bacteroidota bacterium]
MMKLKVKVPLMIKPNKDGHYPKAIAERLISFGLAERDNDKNKKHRRR